MQALCGGWSSMRWEGYAMWEHMSSPRDRSVRQNGLLVSHRPLLVTCLERPFAQKTSLFAHILARTHIRRLSQVQGCPC
jgi:hypothetical protein